MNIFVLDDSRTRHELFGHYLKGANVVHAWTASEAYPLLRHRKFDVVFLDHDLEESGAHCGSGTEVVTAIAVLHRMSMYPSHVARHCIHSLNPGKAQEMFDVLRTLVTTNRCTRAWEEAAALAELRTSGEWTLPERWLDPLVFEDPVQEP